MPTLREAWEENADDWARWARTPGHDTYWKFHRDRFLELVPPPGRLTLDVGCGEGRLARDLKQLGHNVVAVDASPTLVLLAREADPELEVHVADAAALPFDDGAADLALAFMSLMDMDDMTGAVGEIARVLEPGGRLVVAVVHPINSAGTFASDEAGSPFVMPGSYFDRREYRESIERSGLQMTFASRHHTFADYVNTLIGAGFVVDAVREIEEEGDPRWSRQPLFLHLRALKAAQPA
jgi:ubiquinone/menaquinone biosynthesis C-methylase UbiE